MMSCEEQELHTLVVKIGSMIRNFFEIDGVYTNDNKEFMSKYVDKCIHKASLLNSNNKISKIYENDYKYIKIHLDTDPLVYNPKRISNLLNLIDNTNTVNSGAFRVNTPDNNEVITTEKESIISENNVQKIKSKKSKKSKSKSNKLITEPSILQLNTTPDTLELDVVNSNDQESNIIKSDVIVQDSFVKIVAKSSIPTLQLPVDNEPSSHLPSAQLSPISSNKLMTILKKDDDEKFIMPRKSINEFLENDTKSKFINNSILNINNDGNGNSNEEIASRVDDGSENYHQYLIQLCDPFADRKSKIPVKYFTANDLRDFDNLRLWHYGPEINNIYTKRNYKAYERNNITRGFIRAQQTFIKKGFKLLDISDPTKGKSIVFSFSKIPQFIEAEHDKLWHGLNNLPK